jgi:penicillin amidase
MRRRRYLRLLQLLALALLVVVLAPVWLVRRTLPADDERRRLPGLEAPVTIDYDSLGVPVIRAANDRDLDFAQGYAHARDRRFQMELIRRNAAGRLAEVFGPRALPLDREKRRLGYAAVVDSAARLMAPDLRAHLEAYARGVNAWDANHPAPPEFLVLAIPREPWRVQDCLLSLASMFDDLQFAGESETMMEVMDASLPRSLVDFLTPESTPLDVTFDGLAAPAAPATPIAKQINLRAGLASGSARSEAKALALSADPLGGEPALGSNNWVIAAARTRNRRPLVCNDPHLGLSVPVIWQRQRLEAPGIHVTGVTLPGLPGVVLGSNGQVAWGFTNVEGDFVDWVRVRASDRDSTRYRVPGGDEPFRMRREILRAKGARAETLDVRETRWGPLIQRSKSGGWLALQWGGLAPDSYCMDLAREDRAGDLQQLFEAFDSYSGPAQNVVAADSAHIGWRIIGRLPRREGFDPRRPREGEANAGWKGWWPQDSMPRVIDPPAGFLGTANQRTVGGRNWARVGTGSAMPWRARRIHDVLASRSDWDVAGAQGLQNDLDDAVIGPAAQALDRALTPEACARDTTLAAVRRLLSAWTHRADTTSATHAYLRYARVAIHELLIAPLIRPCLAHDSTFSYSWSLEDEVVRRMLDERPMNLLSPRYADYDALVRAAADTAAARLRARFPGRPLERITWGMINRARINHPLGGAVPMLDRWLDMPHVQLAGGSSVVRVTRPASGASMRMVVEIGDAAAARFSLPGGESGHFLSRHYSDEFADWVAGRYVPFEPGAARHAITLSPR